MVIFKQKNENHLFVILYYNISHTSFQQQFFNFQHVNYARNLIFLVCGLRFLKQFSRISFADLKKKISPKKRTMLFKCLKKTRVLLVYHIFFLKKYTFNLTKILASIFSLFTLAIYFFP